MNKLFLYGFGTLIIFGLVIVSSIAIANNYVTELSKEKTLDSCALSTDVLKCEKKISTYVKDYNSVTGKNITADKVKILKEYKVKEKKGDNNPLELTSVEIEGKVYTVVSAK